MLRISHYLIVFFIAVAGAGLGWAEAEKPGTPVTVAPIIRGTVVITEEAMGWIEAKVNPKVAAETAGKIEKIYFDTGQIVKAGSTMLTIDSEPQKLEQKALQADIDRLQALIANQVRTVGRYQNLLAKKSISQERFDNAEVTLITLKEQLQGALSRLADNRRRLGKSSVFAPVSGWVEKRLVSEGDFVKPGSLLFLLVTNQYLRIVLPFPENVASRLSVGQKVKMTSPLSHDRIIEAQINQIRPAVNIQSRALEAIIYLENPGNWRPGGTINAKVIIDQRENGMMVPVRALVRRPAGTVVYESKNQTAYQHQVVAGQRQGELIEIISGLAGNERIILDGAGFLSDGAAVVEKQP